MWKSLFVLEELQRYMAKEREKNMLHPHCFYWTREAASGYYKIQQRSHTP